MTTMLTMPGPGPGPVAVPAPTTAAERAPRRHKTWLALVLGTWVAVALPCEVEPAQDDDVTPEFGWLLKLSGHCWDGHRLGGGPAASIEVCYRLDATEPALRIHSRVAGIRQQEARIAPAPDGGLQILTRDPLGRTHGYGLYRPLAGSATGLAYRIPGVRPDGAPDSRWSADAGWEIAVGMSGDDRYEYVARYSYGGAAQGFIEDRWRFVRGRPCRVGDC